MALQELVVSLQAIVLQESLVLFAHLDADRCHLVTKRVEHTELTAAYDVVEKVQLLELVVRFEVLIDKVKIVGALIPEFELWLVELVSSRAGQWWIERW